MAKRYTKAQRRAIKEAVEKRLKANRSVNQKAQAQADTSKKNNSGKNKQTEQSFQNEQTGQAGQTGQTEQGGQTGQTESGEQSGQGGQSSKRSWFRSSGKDNLSDYQNMTRQTAMRMAESDMDPVAKEKLLDNLRKHDDLAGGAAGAGGTMKDTNEYFKSQGMTDLDAAFNTLSMHGQGYFLGGDLKRNAARIGAAGAGVGVGARLLKGGTLTHDEHGNRDIAGIPFI